MIKIVMLTLITLSVLKILNNFCSEKFSRNDLIKRTKKIIMVIVFYEFPSLTKDIVKKIKDDKKKIILGLRKEYKRKIASSLSTQFHFLSK